MATFDPAYERATAPEGGWCHVKGDAGGETYVGITRVFHPKAAVWPLIDAQKSHPSFRRGALAFSRHLATLPELAAAVKEHYRTEWWDRMGLDRFPQRVANEVFEESVNMGRAGAGKYLQRFCNAFNYQKVNGQDSRLFVDLAEDGAVGPKTLEALGIVLARRVDEAAAVHALNCLQGAHYLGIGAKRLSQRKFVAGWMTRTHDD